MKKQVLLSSLIITGIFISGCRNLYNNNAQDDKATKGLYFTYVGYQNPFAPSSEYGVVLGKLNFESDSVHYGSIFSIKNLSTGEIVPVNLEFNKAKNYGALIHWKKKYHKTTPDIYAGNYTGKRNESFKELTDNPGFVVAYFNGGLGTYQKNKINFENALPIGVFMVKLPVGQYQIVNAEVYNVYEYTERDFNSGRDYIVTSTFRNTLPEGPVFTVKPNLINYLGDHLITDEGEIETTFDIAFAKSVVSKATTKLKVADPVWEVIESDAAIYSKN